MTFAVIGSFLLDWLAVGYEWQKIKPVTKVLAMAMVIFWTLSNVSWSPDLLIFLLIIAQLFGLAGDIFLIFSTRWFFAGLVSFLVGHLIYASLIFIDIFSYNNSSLYEQSFIYSIIVTFIFWGAILFAVYRFLKREHFIKHRKGQLLWTLVQVYIWILSGLTALTFLRILVQSDFSALMLFLPLGGVLFLVSDILLSYDRFIKPIQKGQLWVHITYHLAQFSLAVGFLVILGRI